ncbi:GNAT family N-acetyltransferase [Clostridium paridis]|uniref:GNAT family N-acetyltransferase n=1 Tax=Clostridium paridis TaxID=2803863 RepID=A0A937FH44_9CLOT|nr:GNAT family N-acetyltransferase [Clostridium paridis]MBL4932162.1 GNAT family N-acetyltransferase [Clostridium paridis]
MITVTSLVEEDLEELKLIYDEGFEDTNTDFNKMKKTFNRMKENPDYIVLCAKYNGKVIGSIMGIACSELIGECDPFMVIENVVVSSGCRRMGVARLLMEEIEKNAVKRDCSFMMLLSRKHRKGAHKFYESVGFDGDAARGFKKYL